LVVPLHDLRNQADERLDPAGVWRDLAESLGQRVMAAHYRTIILTAHPNGQGVAQTIRHDLERVSTVIKREPPF
jgi:hypothetical protein